MNEVNKNLIDSIVKSAFLSRNLQEQKQGKHSSNQKACVPSLNIDLRGITQPQTSNKEVVEKQKEEKSSLSFNPDYYTMNQSGKKEAPKSVSTVNYDKNKRMNTFSEAQLKISKEDPMNDITETRQLKTERYAEEDREKVLAKVKRNFFNKG